MNFGSSDVDLNLAAALKPKVKRADEEAQSVEMIDESESIIDLADLLKEKVSIFKWISEEPSPSIPSMLLIDTVFPSFSFILKASSKNWQRSSYQVIGAHGETRL